jgi:uncharacterized protein YjbI with pentapeptide repeats
MSDANAESGSHRGEDLEGADFTGADDSRCDVRGATVTDVTWDPDHPRSLDLSDDVAC